MPLEVTTLERVFKFEKDGKVQTLPDPNPDMTVVEVMKFFGSTRFPELTNGVAEGPKVVGDKANYTLNTKAGKLG